MKKIIALFLMGLNFFPGYVLSYDDEETHRRLAEKASDVSSIATYLRNNLDFTLGASTIINNKPILWWIREGAFLEDSPSCRATNHFHNPLKNWGESGLSDIPWWLNVECSSWNPWYSNVTWGTGYLSPDGPQITRPRQWMGWGDARDYFYWALTSVSNQERESYFAKTFQALGQVLHLNQDVSVPAHVRNDFKSHYASYDPYHKPMSVYPNQFEAYVRKNPQLIANTEARPPVFLNPKVTDFWDTDQYTGDNPSASPLAWRSSSMPIILVIGRFPIIPQTRNTNSPTRKWIAQIVVYARTLLLIQPTLEDISVGRNALLCRRPGQLIILRR